MAPPAADANGVEGLTLTVLGCGTMGIAILSGILTALADTKGLHFSNTPATASGTSTPMEDLPPMLPSTFLACVRRPESGRRVEKALSDYSSNVKVILNQNLPAVQAADVVLLGCKPQMFRDILGAEGIKEALKGKLLISILAGVTVRQIEEFLYGPDGERECRIVRVMANAAALIRESMTVIENPSPPLPQKEAALVSWIFNRVGRVVRLPPDALDASTALCGSGPAFMAVVLEAMADGGVAMGIPRAEAQFMAAQTMRGTTGIVLNGEHPAVLKDKVSTPGGCTIGGLSILEEGNTRGTLAKAVREAATVASHLGQGVKGVNATRFR